MEDRIVFTWGEVPPDSRKRLVERDRVCAHRVVIVDGVAGDVEEVGAPEDLDDNAGNGAVDGVGRLMFDPSPFETLLSWTMVGSAPAVYEFFVKLKGRPYREARWVADRDIQQYPGGKPMTSRFLRKWPTPPSEPYYDPVFDEVDRVIDHRVNDGRDEYLVKWCQLGYEQATWEVEEIPLEDIEAFRERSAQREATGVSIPQEFEPLPAAQSYKGGNELFAYQTEGVNWLLFSWYNGRNCILADEMGLGKTVQALAFLARIHGAYHVPGPFLVIAPLATLLHWERLVRSWTDFNVVVYSGNAQARKLIQQTEFYFRGTRDAKFDVLVTSYELVLREVEVFSRFSYTVLIVDEAHRLKNANSKLHKALEHVRSGYRILLTGTPIQNTIEELQSLLEFLHPGQFRDVTTENCLGDIGVLKDRLQPHLLRRVKADVDQSIAAKEETIIECPLTREQKKFYRAVLEQNASYLSRGTNLTNIAMELRKICLHPYLVKDGEAKVLQEKSVVACEDLINETAIRASGKMILLDKLLARLKERGHRVLVFSQMTRLLDILERYMRYRGFKYLRIDGSVKLHL